MYRIYIIEVSPHTGRDSSTTMMTDSFGLDDLFTVKDYHPVTIHIPRNVAEHDDDDGDVLTIEILHSPAACTDPDLTGQVLWPVSRLLSHYLASSSCQFLRETTVLELGAGGTALPSLTAASCGASAVIATDGNCGAVLDLLRQNVSRWQRFSAASKMHPQSSSTLSCRQLQWGNSDHVQSLLRDIKRPVDVVLAADVVQWPAVIEPLLHTVKAVMWRSFGCMKETKRQPVFLLGIVERASTIYKMFFALADELGFCSRPIASTDFLPNGGIVPVSCQEHGGRISELYELALRADAKPPVLLQPEKQDKTVGTSFELTTFLPC